MKHLLKTLAAIGLVLGTTGAWAGEITTCLTAGDKRCGQPVLKHVPFKAVVLEVIDPQHSGIGESISRYLWREVLFSIRDMSGRGVILGKNFEGALREKYGKAPSDMLDSRFHDAADQISAFLNTQMSLWGAVINEKDSSTLYTFLSVPAERWAETLGVSMVIKSGPPTGIASRLSQTRFNFKPLQYATRQELFGGHIRVRCTLQSGCPNGIAAYDRPADGLEAVKRLPAGSVVTITDMSGKWMRIITPDGKPLYLNIKHTEIAPPFVRARNRRDINLRRVPGSKERATVIGKVALNGRYEVQDMALVGQNQIPWYRIKTRLGEGWVAGWLLDPLYRFPLVHFVAALYRYGARQFDHAEKEFRNYLQAVGSNGDRLTRSAALQLIAVARARALRPHQSRRLTSDRVLQPLKRAEQLTPFDPAIFRTRGLLKLMSGNRTHHAIDDFSRAAKLAPHSGDTKALLNAVIRASNRFPDIFGSRGRLDIRSYQRLSNGITPFRVNRNR